MTECQFYKRDTFLWFPDQHARSSHLFGKEGATPLQRHAVRSFYYTSIVGDNNGVRAVEESLWALGFSPMVFKKPRNATKAKGVDIALTKDVLSNAFLGNYDVAVLVAGDGDCVPLVDEVKRLGKVVLVAFFSSPGAGLSPELKLSSDQFIALDDKFQDRWNRFMLKSRREESR